MTTTAPAATSREPAATPLRHRTRIRVEGIVQGVGYRPFVFAKATRAGLNGFVGNDSAGVFIEVEGDPTVIQQFVDELRVEAPPLAAVSAVSVESLPPIGESGFTIVASLTSSTRGARVSPDSAACPACLSEVADPGDRRYEYPFTNCTDCGPRFTIVCSLPYDRPRTTMASFEMCPQCAAEYADPANRRFHAQPNACPSCGPRVTFTVLRGRGDEPLPTDPLRGAATALAGGAIVAIKGLGGYHLACDATDDIAVQSLRQRKGRDAKPFAVMVPDVQAARALCDLDDAAENALCSIARPIVLLPTRRPGILSASVSPGLARLGLMLPYTPLHHLLLRYFAAECERVPALVMTSANASDDPILYRDEDAAEYLPDVADAVLTHDRRIHMRCDDSVVQLRGDRVQPIRRSRGYSPRPVVLGVSSPVAVLACGAEQKNTFCLVEGDLAYPSHHIGDLRSDATHHDFAEALAHYERLLGITPAAVAYDLHPGYRTTRFALASPIGTKIGVQHHEAHVASVMAEHRIEGPVIGVAADGTGYGHDGTIWGGEVFVGTPGRFRRFAHLDPVPLPGGHRAIAEPWRMGAVYLYRALGPSFLDVDIDFARGIDRDAWTLLLRMADAGVHTPMTSSLGRLFDAAAAITHVATRSRYEGDAAITLEAAASTYIDGRGRAVESDRAAIVPPLGGAIDVRPLIAGLVADLVDGRGVPEIAWRFHRAIANMIATTCERARETSGVGTVVVSGGVFQNRLLLGMLERELADRGFDVLTNDQVPCNDGGISLGQALIAATLLLDTGEGR